jgi:hypothetical protein
MAEIMIEIAYNRQEEVLEVRWFKGTQPHPRYNVRYKLIMQYAAAVREALQELVDAGRAKKSHDYGRLTRKLAEQGHELYKALFFGPTLADRNQATKVQNWISQYLLAGQHRFTFLVSSKVQVPWGLIYDQPVPDDEGNSDPDSKKITHFWCQKYSAVTQYFGIPPIGIDKPWPGTSFNLLLGADENVWTTAFASLEAIEQSVLEEHLGKQTPPFKFKTIFDTWIMNHSTGKPYGLLSFFCHASGTSLCIGAEDLSATLFEQRFARDEPSDTAPPTLVFLAGCETAIGELDEGFLEATGGPGFCGFIGTEAKVPDIFTLAFFTEFVARFYASGQNVGKVMDELREKHWPLSLVFSVCCPHDLTLEAPDLHTRRVRANVNALLKRDINLSLRQISSASPVGI